MVAWRDGGIVGVLGSWDQSGFKQEILADEGPRLRRLRPAYDLLARAIGARPLPHPGEPIRTAFGDGERTHFAAGCGIVWHSQPEAEQAESRLKVQRWLELCRWPGR